MNLVKKGALAAVTMWVNSRFERYGKVLNLDVDSANKTVHAEVLPKGETSSIIVTARYEVRRRDGEDELRFSEINISREWINVLLKELGRTEAAIPVPPKLGIALRAVL